jgi:TonB family protein
MTDLAAIPLLRATGWALLHSLWQGALLALLAAGALWWLRHRSAELRYGIACTALALMVLAFFGTLAWVFGDGDPLSSSASLMVAPLGEGQGSEVWISHLRSVLSPWIPWLFLGWMLGFTLRLALMGRSLVWLYGPCLGSLQSPPEACLARFEALRVRSRVHRFVRLGVSDRVDSLMVMGWLKPVVLIPAAALLALSPEALEALLVHELAHIRRGDFLANMIQTLAESLLFYHPAAWWLSRRIRQEREHCCDDAAVQACGDPLLYASALARLEELRSQPNAILELAPAASGGHLMSRIHRLLQPRAEQQSSASFLSLLLPALLLVAALGTASYSMRASEPMAADSKEAKVVDMDFSQIRVKHQPEAPAYPPEAKARRIQGTVVVVLTIDPEGKVATGKAISGPPELQDCALAYAKAWEFEPAKVKGKPMWARFKLTMPFRLR